MLLNIKVSILFVVLFLNSTVFSQRQNIGTSFIVNYQRSDYQGGSQTWDVQQGNNGMMYFANNNGLLEYDGIFWNLYPLPNNSVVRCININADGKIFSGGFNEFGYFEKENFASCKFHSLKHLLPEDARNFDDVWKIIIHHDEIIFQSYNQLMIYKDSLVTVIPAPSRFYFSFYVDNEYYVNDMEKGLMRFSMGKLFPLKGTDKIKSKEIRGVLKHKNQLIISSSSDGVFIYNGNSIKKWDADINNFLKKNQIYCSYKTLNGYFAFGTIQNGILLCTPDGYLVQHLSMNDGLQNNTILSICEDYQGNLWLGTDHGIDFIEYNSPLLCISNNYGISTGYAAIIDSGKLYLGTNQGLFYKNLNSINQINIENKKFDIVKNSGGQVWSLTKFDNSLFCGHNNGTFLIKGNQAKQISDISGGWTYLQIPGNNNKIIGGTYSGLVLFEKVNGEWKFKKQYSKFSESARLMAFDKDGSLWMTHGYRGVYHFFFSDDYENIEEIKFYNSENSELSNQLFGLGKINNEIVFLTGDGVVSFSEDHNNFISNSFFEQFIGKELIRAFYVDESNNIWYFTLSNVGVLRIGEDGRYINIILPFKKLEGQLVNGFEFVYSHDDKNVLLATKNGFVNYKSDYQKKYDISFNTYLRSLYLHNSDITKYFSDTAVDFQLVHSNNHIEFTFSSNDFNNSSHLLYSTYLDGFEKDWSLWNSRNSKEYTNLHEGNYIFKVKSKNIFDKISNVKSVEFYVSPPFHRSVLAFIIYFLLLIILIIIIYIIIKRRINKVKTNNEKQQQELYSKREGELKREALETEKEIINIRNQQLRQGIKQKNKELANSTFETIHKNEILINLRDEMKVVLNSINIENDQLLLKNIIRKVNKEINTNKQWKVFELHFESVHEEFLERIKNAYPSLTPRELKLCAYLRMNISSKEISLLMNISLRGVEISRYRLRKKLNLERKVNLTDYILSF